METFDEMVLSHVSAESAHSKDPSLEYRSAEQTLSNISYKHTEVYLDRLSFCTCIMRLSSFAFPIVALFAFLSAAVASDVIILTAANFDSIVKHEPLVIMVEFFRPMVWTLPGFGSRV